ncbi:hypothetical protein ACQ86N_29625 [Puia sp. P3]|uniref:hypothetical protein n=1 Tax=Puia sp. P3 TaxID=3423952 RepID=UPI003D66A3DD
METITTKETAGVLEDLIRINNDRIEGYEKALKDLKPEDSDLRILFESDRSKPDDPHHAGQGAANAGLGYSHGDVGQVGQFTARGWS